MAWVAGLLVCLVLAGCLEGEQDPGASQDEAGETGSTTPDDAPTVSVPVTVPTWNVGDWWSYQIDYASGESYTAKLIVYDEDGGEYQVAADDRDLTLRAAITHYPTIGGVKKSDLSQSIHGEQVQFLRFPLQHDNWTGTFRNFPASYTTAPARLETGQGPVDGFVTTMRNSDDGLVRLSNGFSPEVGWFTNFTFDFDGVAPVDGTYTLQDWGSNHTGALPVLEIIDGVHGMFPALVVAPPDAGNPAATPPTMQDGAATMAIEADGASLVWALFAGAGGPGTFEFDLAQKESGAPPHQVRWQPSAAGSFFDWGEIADAPVGDWDVVCTGAAQSFAFLWCETYEVRTSMIEL